MNRPVIFRQGGFTLIELMVVVAIVAVLAVIALPTYQNSVRKGRRGNGKSDMVQLAQNMERCATQNSTYINCPQVAPANVVIAPYTNSPQSGTPINYILSFSVAPTRLGYTILATPQGDQARDVCGALTLDNTGAKTPVIGNDGSTSCW